MRHLIWRIFVVLALCGPVQAEEMLPVSLGHHSVAFPLEERLAPLPVGTWLEFTSEDENGVPRKMEGAIGLVLGEAHSVLFIEVTARNAAWLAKRQTWSKVKYQKLMDPDPKEISERFAFRHSPVIIAPDMRTLTVSLPVDRELAIRWKPGDEVVFLQSNGKYASHFAVSAIFVSAMDQGDGTFELTIVADPWEAKAIATADLKGGLSIEKSTPKKQQDPSIVDQEDQAEKRCFITRRLGAERQRIEIPSSN